MPKRKRPEKESSTPVKKDSSSHVTKKEALRFEVELEFVQCLANPDYIHHLALKGTLDDVKFIKYLKYMQDTWTKPEYSRFLTFPNCLNYLHLLQESTFRQMAKNPQFIADVNYQRDLHFFHHKTADVIDIPRQ
jgi:mediator of RNA polymerase II transcription subunit 31